MFWIMPDAGFTGEGDASVVSFADNTGRDFIVDLKVSDSEICVVFRFPDMDQTFSYPLSLSGADRGGEILSECGGARIQCLAFGAGVGKCTAKKC